MSECPICHGPCLEDARVAAEAERLYGVPGAEEMYDDPAAAYECQIEPWLDEADGSPQEIEEWSVRPAGGYLWPADLIIEHTVEMSCDELTEGAYDSMVAAAKHPEVVAAFEAARAALGAKLTYRMAAEILRTLVVTWDEAGEPLLDGEPMYVKRVDA